MLGLCLIADPRLIYSVVFILPPVYYGCVLCYWVRWIYQGRRVGQFTHQGDNYRVIGVLTLSALTIFVSSLLASPLHKRTQHVWQAKRLLQLPRTCSTSKGPGLNSCVCLVENLCTIVYRCLWPYLHITVGWLALTITATAIINLTSSDRYFISISHLFLCTSTCTSWVTVHHSHKLFKFTLWDSSWIHRYVKPDQRNGLTLGEFAER